MTALTATPGASTSHPRARALTAEGVFIRRSVTHSLRSPDALVMAVVLPTMLMLLFTLVFGGALESDGSYVDYVVPGIILLCAGYGAASTAVDVAHDMATGVIDRFRSMPVRASAVITGHVVASLARNIVATAIVIGVAVLVGYRPQADVGSWLLLTLLVALYILAITFLFAAIGLVAGSPEAASGYGFIIMFLPYLSSAFVEVRTMPVWLRPVAEHQPLTPIIETARSLLAGHGTGTDGWLALAWTAGILLVALGLTAVLFRRRARRR